MSDEATLRIRLEGDGGIDPSRPGRGAAPGEPPPPRYAPPAAGRAGRQGPPDPFREVLDVVGKFRGVIGGALGPLGGALLDILDAFAKMRDKANQAVQRPFVPPPKPPTLPPEFKPPSVSPPTAIPVTLPSVSPPIPRVPAPPPVQPPVVAPPPLPPLASEESPPPARPPEGPIYSGRPVLGMGGQTMLKRLPAEGASPRTMLARQSTQRDTMLEPPPVPPPAPQPVAPPPPPPIPAGAAPLPRDDAGAVRRIGTAPAVENQIPATMKVGVSEEAIGKVGGTEGGATMAEAAGAMGAVAAIVAALKMLQSGVHDAAAGAGKFGAMMVDSAAEPSRDLQNMGGAVSAVSDKLFYIDPALGIFGSAIGGAVEGLGTLIEALDATATRYGAYSPQIAAAQAIADVTQTMNDLRRAQEIAPETSQFVTEESALRQKIEDEKLKIMRALLPLATTAMKLMEQLMPLLDKTVAQPIIMILQGWTFILQKILGKMPDNTPEFDWSMPSADVLFKAPFT